MKTTTGYFACAVLALVGAAFTPACSSAVEEGTSEGKIGSEASELTGVKTAKDLGLLKGDLAAPSDSKTFAYSSNPSLYRSYKFAGAPGDQIDIAVTTTKAIADVWVLDDTLSTLAHQVAPSARGVAHVAFTVQAGETNTHYLVMRELSKQDTTFKVTFSNTHSFTSCNVDADCVATTAAPGCCNNGTKYAVNAKEVAAWDKANKCNAGIICPMYIRLDNRVAECNNTTHTCEMVAPSDIVCQAFSVNSHSCPAGYNCAQDPRVADIGGKCVETCGGITGKQCSQLGDVCVDDPNDSCDPAHGGADCGGICQPKPACVNNKMCVRTSHFDATACACVPNAACGGTAQTHCDAQFSGGCVDDPNGNCHLGGGDATCTGVCAN